MSGLKTAVLTALLLGATTVATAGDALSPETISGSTAVDASGAKKLFDEGTAFVDVRKDSDWEAGRIPGAIHIELKKKFSEASLSEEVAKDEKVVMYCNGPKCMRSSKAVTQALAWGYSDVYYFREGVPAWKAAGFPVE